MNELHLTLEDYPEMLRKYSIFSPYRYQMKKNVMLIYFVSGAAFGSTDIPIPESKDYEVSSNTGDGFIVWTAAE